MKGMTLRAMTQAVNGIYHGNGEDYDKEITAITIDSRKVAEGGLFIAIKGERSDGHDFIGQCFEKGAACVISEKELRMGTAFRHKRRLTTGGALHRNHRLWCQIQGGGKRRSGATSIDDNAVDDAIAGEADRRSPPAVSPYTHLRVATLLQMRFSAYHGDAMLHCTLNLLNMHIVGLLRWKPSP